MILLRRVAHGVRSHFPLRLSEWLMAYPSLTTGLALLATPDLFTVSPSYDVLAGWADEETWGALLLLVTALRLAALFVNGTFDGFRLAPHIRMVASGFGALVWSQFCLGLLLSALDGVASWIGPSLYSTLVLAECANWYRSWLDIGKDIGRRRA